MKKRTTAWLLTGNNIENGISALREIAAGKDVVQGAMRRSDLADYGGTADVTFYWGSAGDAGSGFKKGYGILHIAAKHGKETLIKMLDVIANGSITRYVAGNKTVVLEKDGYQAVLSLARNGNVESWLLSGWKTKEEKTGGAGEVSTATDPTQANPTFSRDDLGAVLSGTNVQHLLNAARKKLQISAKNTENPKKNL